MRITPFEPRHAAQLDLRPMDVRVLTGMGLAASPEDMEALGRTLSRRGPAFTAWAHCGPAPTPIACAGLAELWPGTAEAWALTSHQVARHGLAFHRAARRMLPAMARRLGLTRIQATVLADFGPGIRWLEGLGFTRETPRPMRRYVGDDAYLLFSCHPNPRS